MATLAGVGAIGGGGHSARGAHRHRHSGFVWLGASGRSASEQRPLRRATSRQHQVSIARRASSRASGAMLQITRRKQSRRSWRQSLWCMCSASRALIGFGRAAPVGVELRCVRAGWLASRRRIELVAYSQSLPTVGPRAGLVCCDWRARHGIGVQIETRTWTRSKSARGHSHSQTHSRMERNWTQSLSKLEQAMRAQQVLRSLARQQHQWPRRRSER